MRRFIPACLLVWSLAASAHECFIAYNTYLVPPYLTQSGGLAGDLVTYLNKRLQGKNCFQLEHLSRNRLLQTELKKPAAFQGVVLFLHPEFVADRERKTWLWTDSFINDYSVIVSPRDTPIDYKGLESLRGKRFGGVPGNRYRDIDAWIEAGGILHEHSSHELSNLRKLAEKRIDFTQMGHSVYLNLAMANRMEGLFHTSLHFVHPRAMLVGPRNRPLYEQLQSVIAGMREDPEWQRIMKTYHLER